MYMYVYTYKGVLTPFQIVVRAVEKTEAGREMEVPEGGLGWF